jgi:hypothetical protein
MSKKYIFLFILSFLLLTLIPTTSMAQGFFEHQDTTIPVNQSVQDVVVVGGDATIAGTVENAVVVINGDAVIQSTAHIKGMVLVIGGHIRQFPGAVLEDDVISVSLDNATQNSLLIGSGLLLSTWVIQFIGSFLLIIIPMLIVLLLKHRLNPFVQMIQSTPKRMLGIGFFISLLVLAVSLLLAITLIGIPVVLLLLLLVGLSVLLGLTALGLVIGEKIQAMPRREDWLTTGMGAALLISVMNIPILGILIMLGVTWLSLGLVATWTLAKVKNKLVSKK